MKEAFCLHELGRRDRSDDARFGGNLVIDPRISGVVIKSSENLPTVSHGGVA
jgi:hypothetical protein